MSQIRRILVTGARGFIGKNMLVRLEELKEYEVLEFTRTDNVSHLGPMVSRADAVVHLAGENRPKDPAEFATANIELTNVVCEAIRASGRKIPLLLSSSTQVSLDNPYAESKRRAEDIVKCLANEHSNPVAIYRLPGVFGKWCRPNYNSVVATFCHNIANGLPIQMSDPNIRINLAYIDDVIDKFIDWLKNPEEGMVWGKIDPIYEISLGDLASQINAFRDSRTTLVSERVGFGIARALYSTYLSYLPVDNFSYEVPQYRDSRGVFVEMLKTLDSGQFSYFSAHPAVTRGGHYHHTKTEKFIVVKGRARFCFRNISTGERYELMTSGDRPQVVESIPGWAHDITNVGDEEMFVLLWANEIFDRQRPDTVAREM